MVDDENNVKPVSFGEEVAPAKNWKLTIVGQLLWLGFVGMRNASQLTVEGQKRVLLRPHY